MKGLNLAEWAIRHRQIVYFFIIAILIGGIWSYFHLGRSEDPSFTIRQMVVTAAWPGATAEEIAAQVADPLEKKLQDTRGLDYIKSFTHDGKTIIYVNLKDSVPAGEVQTRWHEVRNMVSDVWGTLPAGVVGPVINDRFDDVYGSIYAVTGEGFSYEEKRKYAEALRQRMLRIEDVQKVELLGVQEQTLYVEMDQNKLASFGMSPSDVFQLIRQQGLMTPSGVIRTDARNVAVRVTGLLPAADALRAIPIHAGDRSFRLSDVAEVWQAYADPETALMVFNGKPAVGVAVSMVPGGDNLKLGEALSAAAAEMQQAFPAGLTVELVADQPKVVNDSIREFTGALLEALVIVMAVSFFSLGLRSGLVLALCVPVVVCAAFLFMAWKGIDLHIVSLGSLIVSLGLLVDDAIIVIEMMQVKLEEGAGRMEAAEGAYKACALPMLAGTLITAAGFLPVALAEGQTAEYTNSLFWVIAGTLVLSWLASIFVSPVLGYQLIRIGKTPAWKHALHEKAYAFFYRAIRGAVHYRKSVVAGTLALFAAALGTYPFIHQEFFPPSVRPELILDVNLAGGASIKDTKRVMSGIEDHLYGDPRVASFATYIGDSAPRFILLFDPLPPEDGHGQMILTADSTESRDALRDELTAMIAEEYPEARAHVRFITTGPPAEYPVMLRLRGPDAEKTAALAKEALALMERHPQVANASLNWPETTPAVRLAIDQDKVRALGIDNYAVSQDLYAKLSGYTIAESYQGDQLVPVTFRLEGAPEEQLAGLASFPIRAGSGRYVPLGDIADISYDSEIPTIWRRDAFPCVTLRADTANGGKSDSVTRDLYEHTLKEFREQLPAGYTLETDGTLEKSEDSLAQILAPVPVVVFVVLAILIFELKQLRPMVIAAVSGPLGLIGCFLTLAATGEPLGFVAIIGMLAIMGMVIRNSIILLDQIRQHLDEGLSPYRAVIDSAVLRFRPIMLTSFAEVLGMIPLLPNPFWSPMSAAFIGGLAVATPLGLLFVPALYAAWYHVEETGEKGAWEK